MGAKTLDPTVSSRRPYAGDPVMPHCCSASPERMAPSFTLSMKPSFSPSGDDIASAKKLLRRRMQRARSALSREVAVRAEQAAASHMLGIPELQSTTAVGLYAAIGDELRTSGLAAALRAHGHILAYPRIIPGQRALVFHRVDAPSELVPGPMRIPQPPVHAETIALADISMLVVPGLAFDRQGGRLGWGQGYYDVTLAHRARPLCIGYAFACQLVDDVPRSDHDVLMDILITDAGVVRVSNRATGQPA